MIVRAAILTLTLGALTTTSIGCTLESPLAVRRVWADRNTLNEPAVYYDKITHQPMHSSRVKEIRWMYNKGPHDESLGPLLNSRASMQPPVGNLEESKPMEKIVPAPRDWRPIPPKPSEPQLGPSTGAENGPVVHQFNDGDRRVAPRTARSGDHWRFLR